jgi:hypothetical protein
MKKNIDFELSGEEKQKLKVRRISQKMLRDYAPDEIAALLGASPERSKAFRHSGSALPGN